MRKWLTFIQSMYLVVVGLGAQSALIQWSNPSFEDVPGPGRPPLGWYFCGPLNETPPDVHPVYQLNVTQTAKHGKTYAGLVVRDNGTTETLGQSLEDHLQVGFCYQLRLYACRAAGFSSYSRLTGLQADFSQPVKLQLWAGNEHCQREELLAETPAIEDTTWHIYQLNFSPQAAYQQLFLTATFPADTASYNGHLLLDHLSPIIPVDCITASPIKEVFSSGPLLQMEQEGDLTSNIRRELTEIRWVRNGFSLEQHLIPGSGNPRTWEAGNTSIHHITQHLQAYPEALLTVVVGPRKDPLLQHHIRLLAAEFLSAGLSPERCLIRPLRKKDLRRDDWLNKDYQVNHLLWGLSQ